MASKNSSAELTNRDKNFIAFCEELRAYVDEHQLFPDKHTRLSHLLLCWTPHKILFVSIALIVGGFFVPPLGIIDGSELTAVGELLMFGVLAQAPKILDAVRNGKSIKVSKGDLTISASSDATQQYTSET